MPIKCDYKYTDGMFAISAPRGLDILPGRMLRKIVRNLQEKYDMSEYSFVKGKRAAEMNEDVVDFIYLKANPRAYILGSQLIVVLQKLHPSILDPQFIHLKDEEADEFKARLADLNMEHEYNTNDFSVAMPADYFIVVSSDIKKLTNVLIHLKLETFEEFADAISRLADATISIYDEADMFVTYTDDALRDLFMKGIDDFLLPGERVEHF